MVTVLGKDSGHSLEKDIITVSKRIVVTVLGKDSGHSL